MEQIKEAVYLINDERYLHLRENGAGVGFATYNKVTGEPLESGQSLQIGLQHTAGGQDGVVIGDFFPFDGTPCPGHRLVHVLRGNAEKNFQFLGQLLQHLLVIVGDIAAISSGISGKFLLIQALHIVQHGGKRHPGGLCESETVN